jgi:hypothetical protein
MQDERSQAMKCQGTVTTLSERHRIRQYGEWSLVGLTNLLVHVLLVYGVDRALPLAPLPECMYILAAVQPAVFSQPARS